VKQVAEEVGNATRIVPVVPTELYVDADLVRTHCNASFAGTAIIYSSVAVLAQRVAVCCGKQRSKHFLRVLIHTKFRRELIEHRVSFAEMRCRRNGRFVFRRFQRTLVSFCCIIAGLRISGGFRSGGVFCRHFASLGGAFFS